MTQFNVEGFPPTLSVWSLLPRGTACVVNAVLWSGGHLSWSCFLFLMVVKTYFDFWALRKPIGNYQRWMMLSGNAFCLRLMFADAFYVIHYLVVVFQRLCLLWHYLLSNSFFRNFGTQISSVWFACCTLGWQVSVFNTDWVRNHCGAPTTDREGSDLPRQKHLCSSHHSFFSSFGRRVVVLDICLLLLLSF